MSVTTHGPSRPIGSGLNLTPIVCCLVLAVGIGVAGFLMRPVASGSAPISPASGQAAAPAAESPNDGELDANGLIPGDEDPAPDREFVKKHLRVTDQEIDDAVKHGNYWRYQRDAKRAESETHVPASNPNHSGSMEGRWSMGTDFGPKEICFTPDGRILGGGTWRKTSKNRFDLDFGDSKKTWIVSESGIDGVYEVVMLYPNGTEYYRSTLRRLQ